MKFKRGLDQTTAWIGAFVFSALTFTGAYLGLKALSGQLLEHAPSSSSHASDGHHGESPNANHGESGHGEKSNHSEHAAPGHEEKAATDQTGHGENKEHDAHGEAPADHHEAPKGDHAPEKEKAKDHGDSKDDHGANKHNTDHGDSHGGTALAAKSHAHWAYNGTTGPEYWGDLAKENVACSVGSMQSPIDIGNAVSSRQLDSLEMHYQAGAGELVNNGHTLQFNFPEGSYSVINETRFNLVQMHFHTPSEHKVQGIPFDMEVHFVHKNSRGKLAVIGVLIEESMKDHKTIAKLWQELPKKGGISVHTDKIDPMNLIPKNRTYFHYLGSLTTPPCSEGVEWYVMTDPIQLSAKQIDQFINVIKYNARPVQPLQARLLRRSTK